MFAKSNSLVIFEPWQIWFEHQPIRQLMSLKEAVIWLSLLRRIFPHSAITILPAVAAYYWLN
ncbi:MAG: hypothetical protein HC875_10320 [Anaerolineales bacterium]|nr:hypothetical protein [Anaerolineales bacterium]